MDFQDICTKVRETARKAGDFIAEQRTTFSTESVEKKGHQNLVSYVDKEAEKMIVAELLQIVPKAAILGEEGTSSDCSADVNCKAEAAILGEENTSSECLNSEPFEKNEGGDYVQASLSKVITLTIEEAANNSDTYCWVIDPLDGTTNFVHGIPPYCVSIALMKGQEVVVGVVYEITRDECFYAWKGSHAYLNGKEVKVSQESEIGNSLVITGLAYNVDDIRERFNHLFDFFNRYSHGARRTGSAAANLIYVAAGRAECFYQSNLSPWDVAAGVLIVERAGGRVSDYSDGNNCIFGRELVATNGITHQKFLDIVR